MGPGRKHHGAVEEDEEQERMPRSNEQPRPTTIRHKSAPPPDYVDDPAEKKRVVDVKPAAPIEAKHLGGLLSRVAIRGGLAPAVVKMKRARHVREQADAGNRPREPCNDIPLISFAGECEDRCSGSVSSKGQPDRGFD